MHDSSIAGRASQFQSDETLAWAGQGLLGLCFIAIGGWHVACYSLVAAYLDKSGVPHAFIWLSVALPLAAGFGILYRVHVREAALALIAWLILITLLLNHELSSGGIGGYPNFKGSLVNAGIIGALLVILAVSAGKNGSRFFLVNHLTTDRLLMAGRVTLATYFLTNAAWQWFYIEARMEHVEVSGGNPNSVWASIVLQLVGGLLILSGRYVRTGAVLVAIPLTASTIMVHGNLGPGAPYPPFTQVHQWFVKSSLLAGLLLISSFRQCR